MVPYGFLTSRKQRALQLYRIDEYYRATFVVLLVFLLTQIIAAIGGSALVNLDSKTSPEARENERRDKSLAAREAQYTPLLRKLETVISLKPLIANRIPAAPLIRNIEGAFFQNGGVCLTELKLSNGFDFNNSNSKDDFTIILSGSIKPVSESPPVTTPTFILRDFTKSLTNELPRGAKVDVLRNVVIEGRGALAPFDVKIHYSPER